MRMRRKWLGLKLLRDRSRWRVGSSEYGRRRRERSLAERERTKCRVGERIDGLLAAGTGDRYLPTNGLHRQRGMAGGQHVVLREATLADASQCRGEQVGVAVDRAWGRRDAWCPNTQRILAERETDTALDEAI